MDVLDIWPATIKDGEQVQSSPGSAGLSYRLKRLWDFIRLQLHLHFDEQSGIAAHCTRLHLGSLGEPRFNQPCTHKHTNPTQHKPPQEVRTEQAPPCFRHKTIRQRMGQLLGRNGRIMLSSTCTQYRQICSQEWPETIWYGSTPPSRCDIQTNVCCESGCSTRASCHCMHCATSYCRPHCEKKVCSSEKMPKAFGQQFVCPECAPAVDACQHNEKGCATCDEIHYFKQDLMKCAKTTQDEEIIGRATDVCNSIDIMVGHTARITNQECYWPDLLNKLKESLDYSHVLLKSDYWKKFEGTVLKQG